MKLHISNLESLSEWQFICAAVEQIISDYDDNIQIAARNGEPVEYTIGYRAALKEFPELCARILKDQNGDESRINNQH